MSYAKGKNFNIVFLPLRYSAGDTYCGSGLVFIYFSTYIVISFRTAMFSFCKSYFRLVGLFDWGYTRTKFILLVSWNRYGFTLAGYQNGKSATDPALPVLPNLSVTF